MVSDEVVNEKVVGEVKLKLTEDPHVGTDSEVMRATISPDPDNINANKVSTLHKLLPDPSYKVDIVGDCFFTDKVKVDLLEAIQGTWIVKIDDSNQHLTKALL